MKRLIVLTLPLVALVMVAAAPAKAATTQAPYCSPNTAYMFTKNDIIYAVNGTICTGPVRNVKVTAELWRNHIFWQKVTSHTVNWGDVKVKRSGEAYAGISDEGTIGCYPNFAKAITTWTDLDGTPRESDNSSPTKNMDRNGPC